MNVVDETDFFLFFFLFGRTSISQQNDTTIISFWVRCLGCSAILVRQCNFQNLVLFWPNRPLEHRNTLESRRPILLTKPSHWNKDNVKKWDYSLPNIWRREVKNSCCSKDPEGKKSSTFWKRHFRVKIALGSRHLTQN